MSIKIMVGCGLSGVGNSVVARLIELMFSDVSVCNNLGECVDDVIRVIPVVSKNSLIFSLKELSKHRCKVRDESLIFVFNSQSVDGFKNADRSLFEGMKGMIYDAGFICRSVVLPKMEGIDAGLSISQIAEFCGKGGYLQSIASLNHAVEQSVKLTKVRLEMVDKVKMAALYIGARYKCEGLPATAEEAEEWLPPTWVMYYATVMQDKIAKLEDALTEEIGNRDKWEEKATRLAESVGECFDLDVGEHSSANCPIRTATEILENHIVLKDV